MSATDAACTMPDTTVAPNALVRTDYTYDSAGRLVSTTADPGGIGATSEFAYNAAGEMTGYCPAEAAATCDPASTSDPAAWHYAYDAMGRQVLTIPPVNVTATPLNVSETVYDDRGHVAWSCSHPAGSGNGDGCTPATNALRTGTVSWDGLGRVTETRTYEDLSATPIATTTNTYTADGQLATTGATTTTGVVTGNADTIAYEYDTLGRLDKVKRGGTTLTDLDYVTAVAGFNAVASRSDAGAVTAFGYDWAGRQTSVDGPATGTTDEVTFRYRLDGSLASRVIPGTATETQAVAYDALKRPVTITRSGTGVAGTITKSWNRAGATRSDNRDLPGTGLLYGDGTAATEAVYTYDALGRLRVETINGTDERTYDYDRNGNRTGKSDGGLAWTYTYDRTDQLVASSGASSGTFAYDAYGNMTTKVENAAATTSTMAYADGDHLTTLTTGGVATTLAYDALGRTATRERGGTTETYRYAGTSETVYEIGDGATARTALVDGAGARLAWTSGGTTAWTLFDHLGSMAALIGPGAGNPLAETYRFDGYGGDLRGTSQALRDAGARNPFRFRGELNLGTDTAPLYEMGARFYAPSMGAWTELDTVAGSAQDPRTMNRFTYVHGNPTSFIDPTGHDACNTRAECEESPYDNGGAGQNNYCDAACQARIAKARLNEKRGKPKQADSTKPTKKDDGTTDPVYIVDIPTGPVNLTDLTYASDDWYRLTDWCGAGGGRSYLPQVCEYARTGVGGPDGDRITGSAASALVQTPPLLGDLYQAFVIQTGYDPIAGYSLTLQERQDAAGWARAAAFLPPTVLVYGRGQWADEVASLPLGGPGQWIRKPESMSDAARGAELKLTNKVDGWTYQVINEYGEKKFDGYATIDDVGTVLDVKDNYAFHLNDDWTGVRPGFGNTFVGYVQKAREAVRIADGTPMIYVATNPAAGQYWQLVLNRARIAPEQARVVVVFEP